MTQDVIDQVTNETTPTTTISNAGTLLDSLVGEGKKFKTPEDLAASAVEKDRFIGQLQGETKEMREKIAEMDERTRRAATLNDVLEAIKNSKTSDVAPNQSGTSLEDITRLVDARYQEKDEAKIRGSNRAKSNAILLELVGNDEVKAGELMRARASATGLSLLEMSALAEKSPKAFQTIVSPNKEGDKGNPGFFRTERNSGVPTGEVRNGAYYIAKMKEVGLVKYYGDKDLQKQKALDMDRLGDAFHSVT